MLKPVLLVPAYGATYVTAEALRAAWESGKDFCDWRRQGQYCSIRDLQELSYLTSTIVITDRHSNVSINIKPMDTWAHIPRKRGTL